MNIFEYDASYKDTWIDMFTLYFTNDLRSELSESIIRTKICDIILKSLEKGFVSMCIIEVDNCTIGFGIYQIDTLDSDWCKKEGWGFIREFYIDRTMRRKGYGKQLSAYIEQKLYAKGALNIYLTTDDALQFWEHCGYIDSGELYNDEMHVLVK